MLAAGVNEVGQLLSVTVNMKKKNRTTNRYEVVLYSRLDSLSRFAVKSFYSTSRTISLAVSL